MARGSKAVNEAMIKYHQAQMVDGETPPGQAIRVELQAQRDALSDVDKTVYDGLVQAFLGTLDHMGA
jgi:hypothetical protein